jgi:ABC-type transporter Mla subunit MlaD
MAKQANRMMIGGFVVVAVFLMAASLVVFSSGRFFKKSKPFVLYFDRSIQGLKVGAPVLFQGVQIGSVTSIALRINEANLKTEIPVIIDIEPERLVVVRSDRTTARGSQKQLLEAKHLVDRGLRATLAMQSLITGQLMIELDFFPNTPVAYRNASSNIPEIPTTPSPGERLAKTLQELDLDAIRNHLENALSGIDRLVNNPDLAAALRAMKESLEQVRLLVQTINARVDPLTDHLNHTVVDAGRMMKNLDLRTSRLAEKAGRTIDDFGKTARTASALLESMGANMNSTISAAGRMVSENSPLVVEIQQTLREFSDMSRSIRQLADYLEQHPEALIQGKRKSGGN